MLVLVCLSCSPSRVHLSNTSLTSSVEPSKPSCSCYATLSTSFVQPDRGVPPVPAQPRNVPGPSKRVPSLAVRGHKVEHALAEAVQNLKTPHQLRLFFVHLLVNDNVPSPIAIWNTFQDALAHDFVVESGNVNIGVNETLQEIQRALAEHGKSLAFYGLPEPSFHSREVEVEMEKWQPDANVLAARSATAVSKLNSEQYQIYTEIMDAVAHRRPLRAFVDGKAGRGKTFLVNAICNELRSAGRIVLPTATSAFAAQLYPGGKTTHSVFKVGSGLPRFATRPDASAGANRRRK